MIILGINEDHNATAAVIKDGRVLACASEERFTRIKNDTSYPYKAINSVLKSAGINASRIDYVAFAGIYIAPMQMRIKRATTFMVGDYIKEMHGHWKKVLVENKPSDYFHELMKEERFIEKSDHYYDYSFMEHTPENRWPELMNEARVGTVNKHLGVARDRIYFIDHHKAHAYYAYFASLDGVSEKVAVVTADGWGDGCNATISVAEKSNIKEVHRTSMCNLARIYRWGTLLLGMRPNEHEYKVMGLAPYAKDYIREPAYKVYKKTLIVNGLDFEWNEKPSDMYFYFKDKLEGVRFDGIAGGLQMWLEDVLSEWIKNVMSHTQTSALCYSGGLSMNIKANKIIAGLPAIKHLYVPPSGGDESLAIGAAFAVCKEYGENPIPIKDVYLGHEPSNEEVKKELEAFRADSGYRIIDNPEVDEIADLLADNKVLGRCVGKMEFGARSLGNRAVLCNPSKDENRQLINEKIKFRDFWMPFTPSVLAERADDYIVNPKKICAEYMAIAFDSTPMAREHLKAAIHPCDFTIRPQVVSRKINNDYYDLMKAFERKTGIGGLLNTSLNLHGYPIACTAHDALEVLTKSDLDGLILQGKLILKVDR